MASSFVRPARPGLALVACGVPVLAASLSGCPGPGEAHTQVFLRAFDAEGEPLQSARITFRDARGVIVSTGVLHHEGGFRLEPEPPNEPGDWGRRVSVVDVETDTCSSLGERIALSEDSKRVAVGGHPSLRSKRIDRYDLRATLVCLPSLSDVERARNERSLREGDVRSRIRAAVRLGCLRAPEGADDELREALQDSSAIALGLVHHPDPGAMPTLICALDDERECVRVAAALLLARLGRNERGVAIAALPALEKRRRDPSPLVRLVAEHAVARITPRADPD